MKSSEDPITSKTEQPLDSMQILKVVPSTASQTEIWLSCQLGGREANMAYNESMSVRLQGNLEILLLKTAFNSVIQRHEGMRATFTPDGSQVLIFNSAYLPLRFRDISELTEDKKTQFLKKHVMDTGLYEFDLVKGPLFVMELIKVSSEEHLLTFTGHHLIFDGWSLGLLMEEISTIYSQLKKEEAIDLPKVDEFSDYVIQHYRLTHSPDIIETKEFWKTKLTNPVPELDLPIDFDRPAVRQLKSRRLEVAMPKALLMKSKKFAMDKKVSHSLLLLSIFEVFLSEWTGQKDIVVGLPMAGQALLNKLNLIGHCVNLMPLRTQVDGEQTFEAYLKVRKEDFLEALDHSLISFGGLLQDLPMKRDTSRIPLIPVTFNLYTTNSSDVLFEGLKVKSISNPKSYANFEIIVNLFGTEEEITVEWTYNESLFHESSIWEAAQKYNLLIEKIIDSPEEKLSSVGSFFEGKEIGSELLLHQKSAASMDNNNSMTKELDLKLLIEKQVATFPEKLAVTCKAGSLDYKTLNSEANQSANYLMNRGVKPGDFVGVYLERSCDLVVAVLAILKAGAAYQPIDREIPFDRAKYMINDSGAKFIITDLLSENWDDHYSKVLYLSDLKKVVSAYPDTNPTVFIPAESPIYTIYTSGSTGDPKGVILTHRNLLYFSDHACEQMGYSSNDQIIGVTSVSFDISIMEVLIPFSIGATVHMLDRYQRKDPKHILAVLEEKSISKMFATPTHWQMIVNSGWNEKFPNLVAISGGEELKKSLSDSLNMVTKSVWNVYGPTETTVFSSCKRIEQGDEVVTLGKPMEGTEILLVDKNGKLIKEANIPGEIWITGEGVAKGYIGLDELTAERFIENPFKVEGNKAYKTGDLGSWDLNDELNYLGRIDHQVKIRGYRVELGEIEQKLLLFSKIENAVVLPVKFGEDFSNLAACIRIKSEYKVGFFDTAFIKQVQSTLKEVLPDYMVPTEFFFLEDFPLTASGKIDRRILTEQIENLENKSIDIEGHRIEDLSSGEAKVMSIWESVLKRSEISLDDDFFLLGGHSLLGVRVISLLESEFGVSLSLLTLFQYPTIRALTTHISGMKEEEATDTLVLIKKGSPKKVLCFVHGVGLNPIEINTLVKNMDEDQTIWGLQSPAISGKHEPLESIEEMATLYIKELDRQKISRPYNLIGNSVGGLIVFEMSKQLIAQNRKLGFVGMIDTLAVHSKDPELDFFQNLKVIFSKLKFEFKFFLNDPPYYVKYRKRYLQEMWRKKVGMNVEDSALENRIGKIENINEKAWSNYVLTYLDLKITLFLASRRTFFVKDFKTFGWGDFTKKVESIEMPGEHANMLKPPFGSEFTKSLQRELNHFSAD